MSQGQSLGWVCCAVCATIVFPAVGTTRAAVLLGLNDSATGELYRITVDDATKTIASMTLIGNTGVPLATLERGPDGTIYGYTRGPSPKLYSVDPQTAHTTEIAAITPSISIQNFRLFEGAIAFSPEGIAYGINLVDAWTNALFTINLATGLLTPGASLSDPAHDINGMVWYDGMLIGLDQTKNAIVTINPSTGETAVRLDLENLKVNNQATLGGIGGMTLIGDMIYFSTASETALPVGSNKLYGLDLTSNSLHYMGTFSETVNTKGIGALAVPEPVTLAFLGVGCVAVWARRRQR